MAVRKPSKKQEWQRDIARERIKKLFSQAEKAFKKKPHLSHRYVALARKIAVRFNIRMGRDLKRRFCKKCYRYLYPGINSRARTNSNQRALVIKCQECGHIMRYPYRKERR